MGRDKATLPFGPELMLQRVVRLLGTVVSKSLRTCANTSGDLIWSASSSRFRSFHAGTKLRDSPDPGPGSYLTTGKKAA